MFVGGVTLQVYGIAFVPLKMLGFQPSMALNLLVTTLNRARCANIENCIVISTLGLKTSQP